MTTSALFTAPVWSADPVALIDREFALTHTASDRARLEAAVTSLEALLGRYGSATAIDRYLASQEIFDDRANAYAAVASLKRLGLLEDVPLAWPGWSHPDGTPKRRLRALEFALVRYVSLRSPVAATEIAALEAGAASGELALIGSEHLRFDECGQVWASLAGSALTAARTVPLGRWATRSIALAAQQRPTGPLLYGGSSPELAKRESAVLMSVGKTLRLAGLGADRTVAPESVRNTGTRAIYDQAPVSGGLGAAGAALGIDNPDRVAARIGVRPASAATPVCWPLPAW